MSTQYGSWELENKVHNLSQPPLSNTNTEIGNRFLLILHYWIRKGIVNVKGINVTDILKIIIMFCEETRFWIIFTKYGIFGWQLSESKKIKQRIYFGSLNDKHLSSRYHVDYNQKTIYRFGDTDNTIQCTQLNTNNIISNSIKWDNIGKLKRSHWDYKRICIFNNKYLFLSESQLMIPDAYGAHTENNFQILQFDLTTKKYKKSIKYGKSYSNEYIYTMQQINNKSILCVSADSAFLINPNKSGPNRLSKITAFPQTDWNFGSDCHLYVSEYISTNQNNIYYGGNKTLKHYNLIKNKCFTNLSESNYKHINLSTADMCGYEAVSTNWYNNNPNLLYVASVNRNTPNSYFKLTNNGKYKDNDIVNNINIDNVFNEELYDIRCNQWIKLDEISINLGAIKWKKFIRKRSRRAPRYPTGAGCSDQNCLLGYHRNIIYFL